MPKNSLIDFELASVIDHTLLKADASKAARAKLFREAKKFKFASVCVHPCDVAAAARALAKTRVAVCTVIGFPLGQNTFAMKRAEALDALAHGATELDFVINIRDLKENEKACSAELDGLVAACRAARATVVLKLIIECCFLSRKEIVRASLLAKKAGFDFVKTSTGFGTGGATVDDVALIRKTVGRTMGIKAAGGIRTREDARALLAAGATRLGCSAGVEICSLPKKSSAQK